MNNSDTPIGENGRKELKIKEDDVDNLLDKFFEDIKEEGYAGINVNCLTFDVPTVEMQKTVKEDGKNSFVEVINNPDPKKVKIDPLLINNGAKIKSGKADKEKVEKKVKQIKAKKEEKNENKKKNPSGGNEKSNER